MLLKQCNGHGLPIKGPKPRQRFTFLVFFCWYFDFFPASLCKSSNIKYSVTSSYKACWPSVQCAAGGPPPLRLAAGADLRQEPAAAAHPAGAVQLPPPAGQLEHQLQHQLLGHHLRQGRLPAGARPEGRGLLLLWQLLLTQPSAQGVLSRYILRYVLHS